MAIPPRTVITGTAIPRLDAGATGIHLVWSGPELTPLAAKGYEIRRRSHLTLKTTRICAVFDAARLAMLAGTRLLADELGLIRMHDLRPASGRGAALSTSTVWSVFTQELATPVQQVTVACTAADAFAVAVSGGTSVAVAVAVAAAAAGAPP